MNIEHATREQRQTAGVCFAQTCVQSTRLWRALARGVRGRALHRGCDRAITGLTHEAPTLVFLTVLIVCSRSSRAERLWAGYDRRVVRRRKVLVLRKVWVQFPARAFFWVFTRCGVGRPPGEDGGAADSKAARGRSVKPASHARFWDRRTDGRTRINSRLRHPAARIRIKYKKL